MEKWEYKMIGVNGMLASLDGTTCPTLVDKMDELGLDGWEAYAHTVTDKGHFTAYLKRLVGYRTK